MKIIIKQISSYWVLTKQGWQELLIPRMSEAQAKGLEAPLNI